MNVHIRPSFSVSKLRKRESSGRKCPAIHAHPRRDHSPVRIDNFPIQLRPFRQAVDALHVEIYHRDRRRLLRPHAQDERAVLERRGEQIREQAVPQLVLRLPQGSGVGVAGVSGKVGFDEARPVPYAGLRLALA